MMKHFGHKGLVLGAAMCALAWVGSAQAAGYEVRMPVEKTVRLSPPPETPAADAAKSAKPASPVVDEKKATDDKKIADDKKPAPVPAKPETPKPETPKAEAPKAKTPPPIAAKPDVPKPDVAKPETAKPEAAKPEAAKPKAPPVAKPAPAPKPAPKIDPLALETPPAQAPHEPTVLPQGGNFAGDVEVEFQPDRVILRVATNGPVERVTSFGVKVPRKLALDLHGPWRKKGPPVVRFSTGPVKNVVAGEHPDRLRLAVEFREGAVEPDMTPAVEQGPKGVTVTIPLALHLRP